MTEVSKSDAVEAVLTKKVRSASFDISNFPVLENLAEYAGKKCASGLSDAANVVVRPLKTKTSMRDAQPALDGLSKSTNYYWFGDRLDDHAMLVGLSPNFLSALSEALLGGGFEMSDEEASPTLLDSKLAQMFVVDMADNIIRYLAGKLPNIRPEEYEFKKSATSAKSTLKGFQTSALFSMAIEVMVEEDKLSSFLTFHFSTEFLERNEMLAPAAKSSIVAGDNTQWYADMLDNVNHTAIDLSVMIGKYTMTLSELSKLEVDQIIPLEENAHNALDVNIKTDEGIFTLCKGKLGTFKKNKAVKVVSQVSVD